MLTLHSELCTQSPSPRQTHSKGRGLGIRTRTTRCHGRPQASLTHFPSTSTHQLQLRSSYHSFRRHLSHCCRIYPITRQPRKPATPLSLKFGSITLNARESRFSQPKLELYGLYRALRTLKLYLIGVRNLTVEVDAKYIKGMLSNPDIAPSASINRWILSILMFHFTLVHVPGAHHGPDGLSRRRPQPGDEPEPEDDFDAWVAHA